MSSSSTFAAHAVDLLSGLGPVDARRMFGGYGVYARGVMFGLIAGDELFLKTDDETRDRFRAAGCQMWVYGRMAETNYYRPPDEAHEDPEAMLPWAKLGLEAALRRRAAKAAKEAASAARRAGGAKRSASTRSGAGRSDSARPSGSGPERSRTRAGAPASRKRTSRPRTRPR